MKYNSALPSVKDLKVETNTINYGHVPEYWQEAIAPLYVELLRGVEKILDRDNLLDNEDRRRIQELEMKLQALVNSRKRVSTG
jgi:hypothetical protein